MILTNETAHAVLRPCYVNGHRCGIQLDMEHKRVGVLVNFRLDESKAPTPSYVMSCDAARHLAAELLAKAEMIEQPEKLAAYVDRMDAEEKAKGATN